MQFAWRALMKMRNVSCGMSTGEEENKGRIMVLAGWPPSHRGSFRERNLYSSREEGGEMRDYVS